MFEYKNFRLLLNIIFYTKNITNKALLTKKGIKKAKISFAFITAHSRAFYKHSQLIAFLETNKEIEDKKAMYQMIKENKIHHNPNYLPSNKEISAFANCLEHSNYVAKLAKVLKTTLKWITTAGQWRRVNVTQTQPKNVLNLLKTLSKNYLSVFKTKIKLCYTSSPPLMLDKSIDQILKELIV